MIILLVLGGLVGMLLGLVVLSSRAAVAVVELAPHEPQPRRQRAPPPGIEPSKRVSLFPPVPPPLAPTTDTPGVLVLDERARQVPTVGAVRDFKPSASLGTPVVQVAPLGAPVPARAAPEPRPPPPVTVSPVAVASPVTPAAPPPPAAPVFSGAPAPPVAGPTQPVAPKEPGKRAVAKAPPPSEAQSASNVDVAFDAVEAIASDRELVNLLKQGHLIPALKRYRAKHGVGLEEAKAALEAFRTQAASRSKVAKAIDGVAREAASDPQIVAAIRRRNFVEAIKLYRARTGVSLQDAKQAIDAWRRHLGA